MVAVVYILLMQPKSNRYTGFRKRLRTTIAMNECSFRCKQEVFMKLTNLKAMVAKAMTVGMLAGALVLASQAKAQAQGFGVGVQIGYPPYGYSRDYYERLRCERERREAFLRQQAWERQQAWQRHEAWERHEGWERDHRYGYGYGYRH
jgi:hypothetical protein